MGGKMTGPSGISLYLEISIVIGGALLAGSLIGLERSYHSRPAGRPGSGPMRWSVPRPPF